MCFAWLLELQTWIGWSRALVGGCASYCLQIYRDNNTVLPVLSTGSQQCWRKSLNKFVRRPTRGKSSHLFPYRGSDTGSGIFFKRSTLLSILCLSEQERHQECHLYPETTSKHLLWARVTVGYSKLKERNHRPIICKFNRGKFHLLFNILTKRIFFLG